MNQSDAQGIHKRGRLVSVAGLSFFNNPMYYAAVPLNTPEQLCEWNDCREV